MLRTPDGRKKSDAAHRDDRISSLARRKSVRTVRFGLELLESRLLLSGSVDGLEQYSSLPVGLLVDLPAIALNEPVAEIAPVAQAGTSAQAMPITMSSAQSMPIGASSAQSMPIGASAAQSMPIAVSAFSLPAEFAELRIATFTDTTPVMLATSVAIPNQSSYMTVRPDDNPADAEPVRGYDDPSWHQELLSTDTTGRYGELPQAPIVEAAGYLEQGSMTLGMPLSPGASAFRVGVRPWNCSPTGNGLLSDASTPYIDDIALYNASGQKLADMPGHWDPDHQSLGSFLLSMSDIPGGSQLVFRISSAAGTGQEGSDGAVNLSNSKSSTTGGGTQFVFTIQEFGKASQSSFGSSVETNESSAGFAVASEELNTGTTPLPNTAAPDTDSSDLEEAQGSGASTATTTVNIRLPTGPLIARGANPLGGILTTAATEDDPAPAIERLDGSLTAFLDGLDDGDELLSFQDRPEEGSEDPAVEALRDETREDVVGHTPGNLPLVASRPTGGSDPAQLAAFLATLPALLPESAQPGPIEIEELSEVELTAPLPTAEVLSARRVGSWASAAFGLTIGLTLTSGPYFPDLLNRVRKGAPRKARRGQRSPGESKKSR